MYEKRRNEMPRYPEIRKVLKYRTPEDIEAILESANIDPEYMEDFLSTLGNVGKSVAGALPSILPVVGTVVGTAYGGPVGGAVGGALGGSLGGSLGGAQRPGQPPPTQMPSYPVTPQIPGALPPAAQLLQAIFQPAVLQALIAMLMGQAGAPNIKVGNTSASPGAFTNMISVLADQASAEYNAAVAASGKTIPPYLVDFAGEVQGDIAVPEYRASRLLEMLQEDDFEQDEYYREDSSELRQLDDWVYEEMELTRLYSYYEA
jgi:hypothetical protein